MIPVLSTTWILPDTIDTEDTTLSNPFGAYIFAALAIVNVPDTPVTGKSSEAVDFGMTVPFVVL
jgi:hypothetical protein